MDVPYLSGHLGLAEATLAALVTQPTADLVAVLLEAVTTKAHEFDSLYSDKLKVDIELESAIYSSETRCQTFKATADKALADVEEARQKVKEEETLRQAAENELQLAKSRVSDYESEIHTLRDRVESLQSSNRANMALLESRNKRDDELSEELKKQHEKIVQLNKDVAGLEQAVRTAQAAASSAKYQEELQKEQLRLAAKNSEWLEAELKTKSDEALAYRREKGARLAELERLYNDARTEIESLTRSQQDLKTRLTAAQSKADEALVKNQQQQENFVRTEQSYKQQIGNYERLVAMSDQKTESAQERVRALEAERAQLRENCESEVRSVRIELEKAKQNAVELQERVQQLEGEIDQMHARPEQPPPGSAPQTPRANGSFSARAASPFATPGSIRSKSAVTATQALDEYYKVKGQLMTEKRRNKQLSEEFDSLMASLEAKAPEINELQAEAETLRQEISNMSQFSQQSYEERDAAKREARIAQGKLAEANVQARILRAQVRDLGIQIQMLLFNMHAREKGLDRLTREEELQLQKLYKGETAENSLADMSDTHQFITEKFVAFKDVHDLQEKNQELLRVTRELADQMESEEAQTARDQAEEYRKKAEQTQQDLSNIKDEASSLKATMESYKAERDMFRRLLQQKATAGELASILGDSLEDGQRPPLASIETGMDDARIASEALESLRDEFTKKVDEGSAIRNALQEQINTLSAEKNSLQVEVARLSSNVTLTTERYETLHANFMAIQKDKEDLQRKLAAASEAAAKQDVRTQQVAEDLVDTRGMLESMRNENANLKAEKKLWKDIQDRLGKDNEDLMQEKSRLNNLLTVQQSLQNERDISESEARRKAQAKIETLESELSTVKRRLTEEMEESKKLQLRKEFDAREAQKRIDELSSNLSQIREELVSVRTSRDHLQARMDEVTIELRNAEERANRLAPRPTPRPGTNTAVAPQANGPTDDETEMDELRNQVSDLKRDLDLANTHLENARAQVDQYRQLSQGNEEALGELAASQQQFQEEMDRIINDKDTKIKDLEQRAEDLSTELSNSNGQLSSLRDSQGEVARRFEDEKNILEQDVQRLKDEVESSKERAKLSQQDLRAQAEIATKAQHDYEVELVKHGEAAQTLQALRAEHKQLRSQIASLAAEAESAKVALSQSETSWAERLRRLQQEISELKARRDDTNAQNKLLHQQLESVTSQISALQQTRTSAADAAEGAVASSDSPLEGLRELNGYLRREKEILEVQYELKIQEFKRLQQQLEYSQSQLDETRIKLEQERRTQSESSQNSLAHKDLMDKLNELNLYRESSVTLRNELGQARSQIAEKDAKIEELEGKVQPLQARIDELDMTRGFLEEELKQIQADRDRWQKRSEDILRKHGRVDPAEMEQLKQKVTDLEAERDALKAQVTELQSTIETQQETWQNSRARLTEQFKERSKKLSGEKNEVIQQRDQLQQELNAKKEELGACQEQLEATKQQIPPLEEKIRAFESQVRTMRDEAQAVQSAQANVQAAAEPSASAAGDTELEQQLTALRQELENVTSQKSTAETALADLRLQLQTAISERDEAVQKSQAIAQEPQQTHVEEPQTQNGANVLTDEERKALEEKLASAEAKAAEAEQKALDVEQKINDVIKDRSNKMRDNLNAKLKESREKMKEEYELKVQQEIAIVKAEMQTSGPAPTQAAVPTTPSKQPEETPATEATGTASPAAGLSQLGDPEIREFLKTNPTVRSILAANLKQKLDAEKDKLQSEMEQKSKTEVEQRVTAAREQATMMAEKKGSLKLGMAEKKLKTAELRLGVVETAVKETPQKPVVEVWEKVQAAAPAPVARPPAAATRASSTAAPSSPAGPPAGASPAPSAAPLSEDNKPATQISATVGIPPPARSANDTTAGQQPPTFANPFVQTGAPAAAPAPNPFAAGLNNSTGGAGAPAAPASSQAPAQRTGIPVPSARGGAPSRGGRGTFAGPGGRTLSSDITRGGFGPGSTRGGSRGGHNPRGGLSANAQEFQPGNKRPRGDSEIGGGAKRARGSHN